MTLILLSPTLFSHVCSYSAQSTHTGIARIDWVKRLRTPGAGSDKQIVTNTAAWTPHNGSYHFSQIDLVHSQACSLIS